MPWSLDVIEHNQRPVLETHYRDVMPPHELAEAVHATIEHARTMSDALLLGNCTRLRGGHSAFDLYSLADMLMATGLGRLMKEAILLPQLPDSVENVSFWETTCLNRGIHVRIFIDRREALDWLTDNVTP